MKVDVKLKLIKKRLKELEKQEFEIDNELIEDLKAEIREEVNRAIEQYLMRYFPSEDEANRAWEECLEMIRQRVEAVIEKYKRTDASRQAQY